MMRKATGTQSVFLIGLMLAGVAAAPFVAEAQAGPKEPASVHVDIESHTASEAHGITSLRPISAYGVENLRAFARLLGYIRYFHPSDGAASADWESLAIAGVDAVEAASDRQALARVLIDFFAPLAPTLQVFPTEESPEPQPAPRAAGGVPLQIVQWVHHGVGPGIPRSPYRSERVRRSAAREQRAQGMSMLPLRVEVGSGLAAWIHTLLYADSAGTLPHTTLAPETAADRASPQPSRYTTADRATRLANVVLAWNVFQHFYPYFDLTDTDWHVQLDVSLQAAALDRTECDHLSTLRRMVATLDDGHGFVGHLCTRDDRVPQIGLAWIENQSIVRYVGPGVEGVKPGDRLLKMDDRGTVDVLQEQMALISSATPQWRYHRAMRELLTGPDNSDVVLMLERMSGDTAVVRLRRTDYLWSDQESDRAVIAELRPGVWYVDLSRISTEEWEATVPRLRSTRGVVFDLRGHPRNLQAAPFLGHLIREPVISAQWYIPHVTRPDRRNLEFTRSEWDIRPRAPYVDAQKVFITDGRAISYAETLLGIVEHYGIGEIVGEATAGTNGNINRFVLPGGYQVVWTGMKVLKQNGSRHHGVGIQPTILAKQTRAGLSAGRDELLEKALEVVSRNDRP